MKNSTYSMTLLGQFKRLLITIKLLYKDPGTWDTFKIAEKFGVSEPTIQRDIRILRKICKIGKKHKGGYILKEFCFVPEQLKPEEAVALALTAQFAQNQPDTPLAKAIGSVLKKTCGLQAQDVKDRLENLEEHIRIAPRILYDYGAQANIMDTLNRAVLDRLPVDLAYAAAHSGEKTIRKVDPYALHFAIGAWYLIGYCHLRKAIRTFGINRIEKAELLEGRRFEYRDGFSLSDYLEHGWHVSVEEGEQNKVKVRFTPQIATYIKDAKWHPKQRMKMNPDGSVLFECELAGLTEISSWIRSFGKDAEVLEPPELRKTFKEESKALSKLYSQK